MNQKLGGNVNLLSGQVVVILSQAGTRAKAMQTDNTHDAKKPTSQTKVVQWFSQLHVRWIGRRFVR